MPISRRLGALCLALAVSGRANAQASVPVVHPTIDGKATSTFGSVFGVRELPNGDVLVNDGAARQLFKLDNTLARVSILLDSATDGRANSYGPVAAPLIAYLGDSSLFVDGGSRSLLVIDPTGRVVRTIAAPTRGDFNYIAGTKTYADTRGNLLYAVTPINQKSNPRSADCPQSLTTSAFDSAAIVRANFDTRAVDTIARVKQPSRSHMTMCFRPATRTTAVFELDPIESVDDWAVLPNGTVALLRGHDYHTDWVTDSAPARSAPRMPGTVTRLTSADKQAAADALQAEIHQAFGASESADNPASMARLRALLLRYSPGMAPFAFLPPATTFSATNPEQMAPSISARAASPDTFDDYLPPFRTGAIKADNDGRVWILPSVSPGRTSAKLVYDVVDANGTLFERVEMPDGRSIAGFGKAGTVYLMSRTSTYAWTLERAYVNHAPRD